MKKTINTFTIAIIAASLGLSSCVKKFDPKSYAPPLNINGYTAADQIATSNLVARWGFNGSLKDSLSATTGTVVGSTSYSTGLEGQALQGASNSYVLSDVPAAIQALHSFTISTWVNMPSSASGDVYDLVGIANPVGFWSNLDIFFDGGGTASTDRLKIHVFNNGTSGTGTDAWLGDYTVNNPYGWVNITLTYDDTSSTFVVYYNGASIVGDGVVVAGFAPLNWSGVSQMVFGTFPFQTTPSLTTGGSTQDWATFMVGSLDEVRVYNKVLTKTEVSSLVALQHRGK